MNLCFLAVKIISQPQLIKIKNRIILIMLVCIPSNTKKISFFRVHVLLNQFLAKKVVLLYRKNDFLVLESSNKIYKKKKSKYIEIYVKSSQICI